MNTRRATDRSYARDFFLVAVLPGLLLAVAALALGRP
jgi:hypothetical protein